MRSIVFLGLLSIVFGQSTLPPIPQGGELASLIHRSFVNVDMDKDGFIEYYEFDTLIIVADTDSDGCMTKQEYEGFSASTPKIADKIYEHFDITGNNCLTVDSVSDEFKKMDTNGNGKVTEAEFETYYLQLLHLILGSSKAPNTTMITY